MEKLYNNSRGAFATFQEGGYLYLSSAARKKIQDLGEYDAIDIYYDAPARRIILELNNDGEFTLSDRICLRSVRDKLKCGRHRISVSEGPEGQNWIIIKCAG
jgi:hypothetical protein